MHLPRPPSGAALFTTRDPVFIRDVALPVLGRLVDRWHELRVDGLEHVPEGRALLVGNHNGGVSSPDMYALMVAYWRHFGAEAPAFGLAHDAAFRFPLFGEAMARAGAVPAHPGTAVALLEREARVLVYFGGDLDAYRAHARRHEIVFGRRSGFIKVALRARAPIVPVVSIGAHESFRVLHDGVALARLLGLKRLARVEVLPLIAGLPWGLWVGPLPSVPLPVRMHLRVLPPIEWPELGPEAASDPAVVDRCFVDVLRVMQRALDQLSREGGHGRRSAREVLRSLRGDG